MKKFTEKYSNVTTNQLYSPNDLNWKQKKKSFSYKTSVLASKFKETLRKKKSNSNELLETYSKYSKSLKQSPIIKALNNIDDFYRNIKPIRSKENYIPDSVFQQKPEILVSYYSKKSSDNEKSKEKPLSDIFSIDQLRFFIENLNSNTLANEDQEYFLFSYQNSLLRLQEKIESCMQIKELD